MEQVNHNLKECCRFQCNRSIIIPQKKKRGRNWIDDKSDTASNEKSP